MKLIHKIYSPFFIAVIFITVLSCNNTDHKFDKKPKNDLLKSEKAKGYLDQAEYYDSLKLYEKAFTNYDKARELYISNFDSIYAGYSLTKMAGIQNSLADYSGSEENAVKALKLFKNNDENGYLTAAYNILGINYKNSLNYNQAISYYNKAAALTKIALAKSILKNNMASVYTEAKNYDKALSILLNLNNNHAVNNHLPTKARVLNNLGEVYFKINNAKALSYLNKALEIRLELNDPKDLISSYINLSKFYSSTDKPLSKMYALKAEEIAVKIKNADERLQALKILSSITDGAEYKNYTSRYIQLQDSVNIVKLKVTSKFAAIRYNSETTETENLQLKAKQAQDNLYKIILAMAIAVIVIIGGFVVYILLLRHRKEKLLQVYKTETRISKKIHDELANDVFKVMSFAESQDFSLPSHQQKLVQNLDSIYTKTRDISRENNTIDTGENYGNILTEMLADYKTETVNVMVVNFETVNWDRMATHKKITVYRILQELMVNMKKHSQASRVAIKFDKDDKKITIQYTDNGCGLSDEKLIYKNGLQNAETRIFSVGGSITFDSEPSKGLKAIIVVPV